MKDNSGFGYDSGGRSWIHGQIQELSLKSMPIGLGDGFDRGCERKGSRMISRILAGGSKGSMEVTLRKEYWQHVTPPHTHILLKSS